MSNQALFGGLVFDEDGRPVETGYVGTSPQYIIDDDGFRRHIDADYVDRQVLKVFIEQIQQNKDLAVSQALNFLGKDDLFTKAALDSSIDNVDMDQILKQGLPPQARHMMGMMGFRIIIDYHGDVIKFDQPAVPDDEEGF